MSVTENIDRIEQGKTSIISTIKSKGVNVPNGVLINEIAPYINEIQGGGGGDVPVVPEIPELTPKYDGASVFRIEVPTDNYEFAINLCNNASTATYDVDWGDGSLESGLTTDEQHHTYAKAGIYDINVYNLSKDITLGGSYDVIFNNYYVIIYYLFNNTNNDSWGFRFNETKDNLTVSDVLIGDKITKIGDSAFYSCTSLQSVVIPEGVTKIGDSAFYSCTSLQSVVIPEGVTTIGISAFKNCYSLQSVVIPEGVTKIGDSAFYSCTSLQSVVIPEGVTTIGISAFENCYSLQSVVIPEGVTSISFGTFQNCNALQNITIPNSVTSIGNSAFQNCYSLQSVVIPEGVTSISSSAFYSCTSLQSVVIPEGVTSISNSAFQKCTSLQSVVIPEGVTKIGDSAFYSCTSLQSVVIPEGITSISSSAFYNCSSLQSVVIPNSVTTIGSTVFYNCSSLQSITVNALTAPTIQSNTFPTSAFEYTKRYLYVPKDSVGYDEGNWKTYLIDKGWELRYIEEHVKTPTTMKLKTVNNFLHKLNAIGGANLVDYELVNDEYIYHFDDKIEEIKQYTFYNEKLKEIELPEGITTIGNSAFYKCSSLQSITVNAMTAPTIQSNVFYNVGTKVPSGTPKILRVPKGATGYDEGNWKTYLIDKGYTLEYIE